MKAVSDWLNKATASHPPILQRIAGIEIREALMHGLESSALRRGHLLSDKEKQDNANWALGKVLQQIKDGTLPDPASMKPLHLPGHVRQQVQGGMKLPMQEAEVVQKPATPMTVPESAEVQKR